MVVSDGVKLAINGGPKAVTLSTDERWPKIWPEEIELVTEMMKAGDISRPSGGIVDEFEETFARFTGSRYCIALNNGTNGLFSAYFAVGVGVGDEVITPSYTWHATVTPIIHCGGIPVFCESSPKTLGADPEDIERKITSRTKAIVVTHMWGNVADMDAIMDISRRHGIPVIEDASHAHGAEWDGKRVGSISDIGVFSMQGSKPLAAGEAGVVVTDNPEYYDRMLVLGHHGKDFSSLLKTGNYNSLGPQGIGMKMRAHPLALAIGLCQLKRLDEVNRRRTEIWAKYDQALDQAPGVEVVHPLPKAKRAGFYEYRAIYKPEELGGLPWDTFYKALIAEGIPTSGDRYRLAHLNPYFSRKWDTPKLGYLDYPGIPETRLWKRGDLPVTESLHERMIFLPSYTDPEPGLVEQIMEGFAKVASAMKAGS